MDNNIDTFDPQQFQAALQNTQQDQFDPNEFQKYLQVQQTPGVGQSFPGGVVARPTQQPHVTSYSGVSPGDIGFSCPTRPAPNDPMTLLNSNTPVGEALRAKSEENTATNSAQDQSVARQTEQALGAKYDPNALSTTERTRLGLAPNFSEQAKVFQDMFPEGKIDSLQGPDGTRYVRIQKTPNDQPFLLSPGSVKAWSEFSNTIKNPNASDLDKAQAAATSISRWMEDNPRLTAKVGIETLVTMASGGAGLGIAGTTGALVSADVATNAALDLPYNQGTGQVAVDSMLDGAALLAGYGAGYIGNAGLALARGRGILATSAEGKQMLKDAEQLRQMGKAQGMSDEELKGLTPMPHQVTSSKLVQLQTGIASRLIDTISHYVDNQRTLVSKIFRGQYDRGDIEGLINNTDEADKGNYEMFGNDQRTGTFPQAVQNVKTRHELPITPAPNITSSEAGNLINTDLGTYADRSRSAVNGLYQHARSIEEPQFDPKPALDAVAEAERGVSTLSNYEKTPIFGTDTDAQGNPIQIRTDINKETTPIKTPSPDLQRLIDKIKIWQNNPPMPVARQLANGEIVTDSVTDQLNALRQEAYDLAQGNNKAGETRQPEALAKKIYGGLTDMLNNTKNVNPDFQKAWQDASAAAKKRFDYLEDPIVRRGYKQDEGDILSPGSTSVNTMGGQVENLQKLKQMAQDGVISPKAYEAEIDSQKRRLFADPENLSQKLSQLDKQKPDLRDELFKDPAELQLYRNLGTAYDKIKAGGLDEAIDKSTNAYSLVDKLFKGGDLTTAEINSLAKADPTSPLGKQMRAAVLDHIWGLSTNMDRGTQRLTSSALESQIRNATAEGGKLTRLLTPADRKALDMFLRYNQGTEEGKGSLGASFAAYSEMSKIRELEHEALMKLVESFGFGKFVTSKFGQKVFYGSAGYAPQPGTLLKALATGTGQYLSPSTNYDKKINSGGQ